MLIISLQFPKGIHILNMLCIPENMNNMIHKINNERKSE